jgi:hypothetical protein
LTLLCRRRLLMLPRASGKGIQETLRYRDGRYRPEEHNTIPTVQTRHHHDLIMIKFTIRLMIFYFHPLFLNSLYTFIPLFKVPIHQEYKHAAKARRPLYS